MELSIPNLKQLLVNSSSLGKQALEFEDDVSITEQGVDSLDMLDFYLNIEETFNISIPDTDLDKVKSFNDLYKYLDEMINEI
jgi:acyl carrier protein